MLENQNKVILEVIGKKRVHFTLKLNKQT